MQGLEHFLAIGVIFGPHPDYALPSEGCKKLTKNLKTQVLIQLTLNQITKRYFLSMPESTHIRTQVNRF
jgi:hypothetical protein